MKRPSADDWFRRVFDDCHAQVLAYCLRRGSPDAEAAAAEVFLVAWRRRDDVPAGDGTLPWLYGTAHRVLANQRRGMFRMMRLKARLGWTRSEKQPTPETVVIRREQDQGVLEAIERLRAADREVLRLIVWEELPQAAVGEILGCSDRAVTMRLHRAVDRLRKELCRQDYQFRVQSLSQRKEAASD